MRTLNEIIVHCSATSVEQKINAATIDVWHRQKGWDCIGYHFVILQDGTIEVGRPIGKIGAHCLYHNVNTVGICYIGGIKDSKPCDTRAPQQKRSLRLLIAGPLEEYPTITKISGHNNYANRACPCFDVTELDYLLQYAIRARESL